MAEAKLTIEIDVDGVGKAVTGLRSVNRAIKSIDDRTRGLASTSAGTGAAIQNSVNKWKKSFDQFDKMVRMVGTIGLKGLTMALKFATIEMVAMGAAMVAIHGAFVLGNAAMKAMKATLGPLAAGMTAVVAAAAAAAAAVREQQAAMYAYKTKSAPEFGSGLNQTRQVMRTLHSDTELATVGIENLNKAYATVSKSSTFTAQSQVLLKGLMDFAAAGQPIEEGITKASELIALLQDSKKSFSEAKASAQQLFPDKKALDKAMKDLKITTKKGLEKAITTGELAKAAGVEGQFEAVSGTLINTLKGFFTQIRNQFADLGQPLLEPIKHAANDIFNILRRGFVKISGNTQRFGMTSMLEGLVNMVDKLTTWSTNLINNNIQSVEGMFEKMSNWWDRFKSGWNETLERLRPFIEGARVIEKAFGEVWKHVKDIVGSGFTQFNEWLQANEETVIEFGGKIGDLFTSIMKFQMEMKKIIQDLMPFINDVIGGISQMVDQMTGFIKALRSITGGGVVGALASLLAIRGGLSAMKNTKGGFTVSQQLSQPIQANQVVINTPSVISGGGTLGTTAAAFGGGADADGLAQRTGGGGGAGSAGTGGGGGTGGGRTAAANLLGPNIPMYGQPGYMPGLIHGPQRTRRGRMAASAFNRYQNFAYNTFMMPGETDEERQNRLATRTRTDRFGNEQYTRRALFRQRAAAQRAARSGPNMSRGYRNFNRFQGSAGARMGTGLALGAMSQFAPAEAQGALALGGMVGTMNPLAGLAVAGLGTAVTSKTATGGALSGAAGGAAAGALLGSIVPGIGTAAGAVGGAIIGAFAGGIMGSVNKDKEERKAAKNAGKEIAQNLVNTMLTSALITMREESGTKGPTVLRRAILDIRKQQKKVLDIANTAPGARGNYAGILPDFMNRGATGGQLGLAIENYTGKRMPKMARRLLGSATTPMDIAGNLLYGTIGKLGGKSLLDNRLLNPLGYGTNNMKDTDRRKQEEVLRTMFRRQGSLGLNISDKQFEDMMKKPGEALDQIRKDMANNEKAMKPIQEKYNSRMDELKRITGKTDTEINDLAKTMGVNLMDSTKDFTEVLRELGLLTIKTTEQMRAAVTNTFVSGLKGFDKQLEAIKAPEILNEIGKGLKQTYQAQGGKLTDEQKVKGVQDIMEANLAYFGGDAMKAYAQTVASLKKGGSAFAEGQIFEGLNIDFLGNSRVAGVMAELERGLATDVGTQLNARLGNMGQSVDMGQFRDRFMKMTPEQQQAAYDAATKGLPTGAAGLRLTEQYGSPQKALLALMGMGDLATTKVDKPSTAAQDLATSSKEIADTTAKLIKQMEEFFKDSRESKPDWWSKDAMKEIMGDTSSPRGHIVGDTTSSRLSQTMARHASMNSMLTGTRTVTSSFRTHSLGSMNSDHVTGRAYDLVGQNLGQYQSLVRATGGFAEFHGVNGARHLHVVPGSGAIGDNRMPVAMSQTPNTLVMGSGGGGGNNYNFYITGSQNASANEIAEIVMQKVKETERSNRERR